MTTVLQQEESNSNKRKQISLDNSVLLRLKKHGEFGMTYSDLVSDILDKIEGKEVNSSERSF
jgi:macrodomain Ter protein organizer (MatP/YcbG family)